MQASAHQFRLKNVSSPKPAIVLKTKRKFIAVSFRQFGILNI